MTVGEPSPTSELQELLAQAQRHYGAGMLPETEQVYRKILGLRPDIAEAYVNLGKAIEDQGRLDEAMAQYQRALSLKPDLVEAHTYLGNALRAQGKMGQAEAQYRRALELRPDFAEAHYGRAGLRKFKPGDVELAALEALAADPARLPEPEMMRIHFALGKALDDLGQYDRAFEQFFAGNALRRREINYDEPRDHELFRQIVRAFNLKLVSRMAGMGELSSLPIFIVGTPRSGTTLVEQILASHPQVQGCGELFNLPRIAGGVFDLAGQRVLYPHYVAKAGPDFLRQLGQHYLAGLPPLPAGKTRITDKALGNFMFVGLIRLILPKAKIIHCRRDPLDTCFSCFAHLFTFGQPFTYNLIELGRYYRRYTQLMQHWRSILPASAMLDVQYEEVVGNLEEQARRLIEYCGLPWDDRCLNFHQSDRPIITASSVQVRQPIYRDSIGRWRHYEKHLAPLMAGLDAKPFPPVPGQQPGQDAVLALAGLAESAQQAGRLAEAEQGYRTILEFRPDIAECYNNLGNVLRDLGRRDEAETCFRRATVLKPKLFQAQVNFGNVYREQGKLDEAVACYRRGLAIDGRVAEAHNNLGATLRDLKKLDESAERLKIALTLKPDYAEAHANYGNVLREQGHFHRAIESFQRALALKPDHAEAHGGLGSALRELGRIDEAAAEYDQALAINPQLADAHYDRASVRTFRPDDPALAQLEALVADSSSIPERKRIYLHFALGKALDDAKQYDRAFEQWNIGNALKRREAEYDESRHLEAIRIIHELFDAALFERLKGSGDPSPAPIFILGMPRSGSTLVEQVLSSHPLVHGAGELHTLGRVAGTRPNPQGRPLSFPMYLSSIDAAALQKIGQEYLQGVPPLPAGKTRLTDKAPGNFWYTGLIPLILPNAKIIHTTRDPIDICISCYSKLFSFGQPFCYDLGELGRYYCRYSELMEHWRAVLPAGAFLDVNYENMVDNLEVEARRLVEYCGLPWDDACLKFHENDRPVSTASSVQVRKPIYRSSVQRWRRYEKHLGPLLEALEKKNDLTPAAAPAAKQTRPAPEPDESQNPAESVQELAALGDREYRAGRLASAEQAFRRIVQIAPSLAEAYHNLGNVLRDQNRFAEAAVQLGQATALKPELFQAQAALGGVLKQLGRFEESAACYRQAIATSPDFAEAHNNLGVVLRELLQTEAAAQCFERAAALRPDNAGVQSNLGNALRDQGDFDRAAECFRKTLAIDPSHAEAYNGLASVKTFRAGDPELEGLEKLVAQADQLPEVKQVYAHFALGKALDDLKQYDRAFAEWQTANALKRRQTNFDEASYVRSLPMIREVFDRRIVERLTGAGDPSPVPIFILGMPRSGSTLVEQVLASHPLVHGAGELPTLGRIAGIRRGPLGQPVVFPLYLPAIDADVVRRMGGEYLRALPALPEGKTRITDKAPGNYWYAGLIPLILPGAKIIHTTRDAVDTCLSCFTHLFTGEQPYSYDLGELGRFYRRYLELMEHWRTILPAGTILDVGYENMVDDLEAQARRLIEFCGLPWDEACLRFHENRRSVSTSSSFQVRKPIYRSSLERWRRYEKHLGPLLAELKPGQADTAPAPVTAGLSAEEYFRHGNALAADGKPAEAETAYRQALSVRPEWAEVANNLGIVLAQQGKFDAAHAAYQQSLGLKPDLPGVHHNLGNLLRDQGKFDEALASYRRAISLKPDFADAYYDLADLKTFRPGDPELAGLEALAENSGPVSDDTRTRIHFALAKALDDAGDFERAFPQWLEGNALVRRAIDYDESRDQEKLELICQRFDRPLVERLAGSGDPAVAPIFILGMPRSGSSLVEQILASHPAVQGAGELGALSQVAQTLRDNQGRPVPYPLYVPQLDAAGLRRLAQAYLAGLPARAADKSRITDKAPGNCWYAGLIHLMLPGAKIIHTMRDPVETCVSCFSKLFAVGQPFSYDLGELGRYFRRYHELMEHWRRVLPAGSILDVAYEDVVGDIETQARRLVEFCGLPWDDRCLAFHRTERPVDTASNVQVRQPLYRSSLARWHRYEQHLGPLLAELADLTRSR